MSASPLMARDDWLKLFGDWWSSFDNVGEILLNKNGLACEHLSAQGLIKGMMSKFELSAYARLPDMVTVYRGCYAENKWGLCWSTKREVAEQFPFLNRYSKRGQRPLLVKARIKKTDISAVKLDRKEYEIVCLGRRPIHISTSTAQKSTRNNY